MRRAICAVTSWAGALRQWPQRRRELHNPPAIPVDQDRRIRLIKEIPQLNAITVIRVQRRLKGKK